MNAAMQRVALRILGVILMVMGFGCTPKAEKITSPSTAYQAALVATDPVAVAPLKPGSAEEHAAIARVIALFSDFSTTNVSAQVRGVYAPEAYLRDGFKELRGIDAIAPYMIRSTEPQRVCRFAFEEVAARSGEYYFRWIMTVNLKRDPPERVEKVLGMSHIRFNAAGQVSFHQDYWDPSDVLYSRIPVAGWLINKVKSGL